MPIGGFIRMNGFVGCLPDSSEVYETENGAIEAAGDLFDDLPEDEHVAMLQDLQAQGIHYFPEAGNVRGMAGADYVSVEYSAEVEHDGES